MDFYPSTGFTEEDSNAIEFVDSLALDDRFDRIAHSPDHLVISESKYHCDSLLRLEEVNLSKNLHEIFHSNDLFITYLEVTQTTVTDQHLATLKATIDGVDWEIIVINGSATLSSTNRADFKKRTWRCPTEVVSEMLAGIILSETNDADSISMGDSVLEDQEAKKIQTFTRTLAQLKGLYASRVVSTFEVPGEAAMLTVLEEGDGPEDQFIRADLNIGYRTPAFPELADGNHDSSLTLLPRDENNDKITGSLGTLPVSLDEYTTVKENGLVDPNIFKTLDRDKNPGEWADLCHKFSAVILPLLKEVE